MCMCQCSQSQNIEVILVLVRKGIYFNIFDSQDFQEGQRTELAGYTYPISDYVRGGLPPSLVMGSAFHIADTGPPDARTFSPAGPKADAPVSSSTRSWVLCGPCLPALFLHTILNPIQLPPVGVTCLLPSCKGGWESEFFFFASTLEKWNSGQDILQIQKGYSKGLGSKKT